MTSAPPPYEAYGVYNAQQPSDPAGPPQYHPSYLQPYGSYPVQAPLGYSGYPPVGIGGGYAAPPPSAGADEVRTIFITGFPPDVKERELNNLLRFLPGYEVIDQSPCP